jgi:hypothetical protein
MFHTCLAIFVDATVRNLFKLSLAGSNRSYPGIGLPGPSYAGPLWIGRPKANLSWVVEKMVLPVRIELTTSALPTRNYPISKLSRP